MEDTHMAVWEMENVWIQSTKTQRWLAWAKKAETLFGLSDLDGDEEPDGYSLDSAYDSFLAGHTPEQYHAGTRVPIRDHRNTSIHYSKGSND